VRRAEIKQMRFAAKLQLMELLWEDLRSNFEQSPVPQCHKELLDGRRRGVESGKEKIFNWDDVKDTIGH
jgi:hypothetical protein